MSKIEKIKRAKKELRDAQKLSMFIEQDPTHPVFDTRNRHHTEASNAYRELIAHIDRLAPSLSGCK